MHVNGFFELSSNRRDIWYGDDMVGSGRLRAEWNCALLQEVVAPSYVSLLLQVRERLLAANSAESKTRHYYALWPHMRPPEPWGGLVDVLYQLLLQQPILYSELDGGVWVTPVNAVFASTGQGVDAMAQLGMERALLRSGLAIVRAPSGVQHLLQGAAEKERIGLRWADPATVRSWLVAQQGWESGLTYEEGMQLLQHCLLELDEDVSSLCGLPLLPLLDGSWGRIEALGATPLLLCALEDRPLLTHRPGLVVDIDLSTALGGQLARVASRQQTNVQIFRAGLLPSLLPFLLPARWSGCELIDLVGENEESEEHRDLHSHDSNHGEPKCGWLLVLWQFIGQHHTRIQLGDLSGWPLLPVEGGRQAYAMPEGGLVCSRMIDLEHADLALSVCVQQIGCLALHRDVSRVHPQLQRVVHDLSACGLLRALRVAAGGSHSNPAENLEPVIDMLFESVTMGGRRLLRSFFAERRHVEEAELNSDASFRAMLRWLPVYEAHSASSRARDAPSADGDGTGAAVGMCEIEVEERCVGLDLQMHRLAPPDVAEALLDERFIFFTNASECGLLKFAGLVQLERSRFYRDCVFPKLRSLTAPTRDAAMLAVLHGLHALCSEDKGFLDALREVPFVPVESGVLRRPSDLFHPKVSEVAELLDRSAVHPSGEFADEAVLSVLERLGLRVQVTHDAVLESARSVEQLCATDADAAVRRSRALLRYVDVHADRLIGRAAIDPINRSTPSWLKSVLSTSQSPSVPDAVSQSDLHELAHISWLPVLTNQPEQFAPWNDAYLKKPFATASETRPVDELWLVSATCRLLDGEVRSQSLRQLLGWMTSPSFFVLSAQVSSSDSS